MTNAVENRTPLASPTGDSHQSEASYWLYAVPLISGLVLVLPTVAPRVNSWLPFLCIIFFAILVGPSRILSFLKVEHGKWFAAVTAMLCASTLASDRPVDAFQVVAASLSCVLLGYVLVQIFYSVPAHYARRTAFWIVLGFCVGLVLEALFLTRIVPIWSYLDSQRPMSIFNRHMVVMSLAFPAILAMISLLLNGTRRTIVLSAVTIAVVLICFTSRSESAKLGVVLALLAMAAFYVLPRRLVPLTGVALSAIYIAWIPVVLWADKALKQGDIWFPNVGYSHRRLEMWALAASHFKERPILGFGPDAMRTRPSLVVTDVVQSGKIIPHPHSSIAQTWLDLGLVGAAMSIVLIFAGLRLCDRLPSPAREAALATLIVGISIWSISHGMWQAWFLGSFAFACALTAFVAALVNSAGSQYSRPLKR